MSPVWVPLEEDGEIRVGGIPQVLKGSGGGMMVQRFDVIPTAKARVRLTFPDALEPKMKKLLQQLEMGSHLNKRRASIRVLKTVED